MTNEKRSAPDWLPSLCLVQRLLPNNRFPIWSVLICARLLPPSEPVDFMSSSRTSPSSSPEPEIVPVKAKKSKSKVKKVKVAHPAAEPEKHGRNEGDDPSLVYKPPEGYVLMKHTADETEFDWDAINNDDNLELWVVRVPDGVSVLVLASLCVVLSRFILPPKLKPKHLENVKIEAPSSSKTSRIGHIDRKSTAYDVWSLGDDDADAQAVGGDELRAVSCLLPRHRKNGKLYQGTSSCLCCSPFCVLTFPPSPRLNVCSSPCHLSPPRDLCAPHPPHTSRIVARVLLGSGAPKPSPTETSPRITQAPVRAAGVPRARRGLSRDGCGRCTRFRCSASCQQAAEVEENGSRGGE